MNKAVKYIGRSIKTGIGLAYDYGRLVKYGAMGEDVSDSAVRNYASAKTYHALEKSLAFKERQAGSGWGQANSLIDYYDAAVKADNIGYHDSASIAVLDAFLTSPGTSDRVASGPIAARIATLRAADRVQPPDDKDHGARQLTDGDLKKGVLDAPEDFFLTRHSIRSFLPQKVDPSLYERAVHMAMKSPTACNRQPWAIYHTDDPAIRDAALGFQSGNRGFGHEVPNLAIVTADHRAYMSGEERNAYLVDGAMFADTLVYAMHALGLGACCLNWSRMPKDDRALRKALNIQTHHGIIMMIGFGHPDPAGRICISARKPTKDIMIELERTLHE